MRRYEEPAAQAAEEARLAAGVALAGSQQRARSPPPAATTRHVARQRQIAWRCHALLPGATPEHVMSYARRGVAIMRTLIMLLAGVEDAPSMAARHDAASSDAHAHRVRTRNVAR